MLMALAAGLTLAPVVTVDGRAVTVGDLVQGVRGQRLPPEMAARVALRLPAGQRAIGLSGTAAAAFVRRQASGWTVVAPDRVVVTRRAREEGGCWISTHALAVGEAVTVRDVAPGACGGSAAPIGSSAGIPIVRHAIAAGAPLGRLAPARGERVAGGIAMTLRSTAGPVTIERDVTTLQPGRWGRPVFVRAAGGQVFAARLVLAEDAR